MTRTLLALTLAAAAFAAPAAHAGTTCQDVAGATTACVVTDTDGTPGAGVQVGPLCVVVLASCS
jgi:hypothetical protein